MVFSYAVKIIVFTIVLFTALNGSDISLPKQDDFIKSKDIYLSYKQYPKRVFTYQKFTITFKAIILVDQGSYDKIVTTFTKEDNIEVLTKQVKW